MGPPPLFPKYEELDEASDYLLTSEMVSQNGVHNPLELPYYLEHPKLTLSNTCVHNQLV